MKRTLKGPDMTTPAQDLTTYQDLFVVASPWGDGTYVVLGHPDPHQGKLFADCEFIAQAEDSDEEIDRARLRAEAIVQADRVICTLRAALVAGFTDEFVRALDESVGVYSDYLDKLREEGP